MARVSNTELLNRYQTRIKASKKWRKDEGLDDTWRRLNDLYRGHHYDNYSEEDRLIVNIGFSTINVISPNIAINYPKITVNATLPENAPQAVIAEAVVNYWMRKYRIRDEFRTAVKDMLISGHGWIKVGYRFVEESAVGSDESISDPLAENAEVSANSVIIEDRPFAERVSCFDVFVDPDATSMRDIRWIAQRIRKPVGEIKSDKRYNRAAREEVQSLAYSRWSDHSANKKINDKSQGYAEVWEFYDIAKNTMCVFSEGVDAFLIKPVQMPYSFGHPFVMLSDYDIPDFFYPMGELEAIEPLQRELNETRSQMLNHRKRYSRKYLFKESAFDNAGRNALNDDTDNTMVPVVGDEPLGGVVVPFPAVINPPEFYEQSAMIIGDIDRVSGVSEIQRGGTTEIRRTATEAGLIQDASNARTADKLATIELSLGEIAKRLIMLAQQFMTGEQVARITGKDGKPYWVKFDREYIAGEFDFEVFAGSTQPVNESFRRQSAMQLMDAMAPFASSGVVDLRKLAAHVLQNGFGIRNPEQFMQEMPPEMPEAPVEPPMGPEQALPPEMPVVPAMPPQGLPEGMPPEMMGMPPEMMMQGAPPMPMGGPMDPSQLPPELLAALLQQGQMG